MTRNPVASSVYSLLVLMVCSLCRVVVSDPCLACVDDLLGSLSGCLAKHFEYQDGVDIDSIDDAPTGARVNEPTFVAPGTDRRHRPRVRHAQRLAVLQSPEQEAGIQPSVLRERWSLDLAVNPSQGFARAGILVHAISICPI